MAFAPLSTLAQSLRNPGFALKLAAVTFAVVLTGLAAAVVMRTRDSGPSLPAAGIGGPFVLTSEDGTPFDSRSLAGRPFALYFGFTHCPDVCPTAMYEMSLLLKDLGPAAKEFRVLFVTVDPERDTAELLKAYTDGFDERIVGLTGTPEAVAGVAKSYRAFYRKVPLDAGSYTMDHTASIYLMGPDGRFAGTLGYGEAHESALAKLRRLIDAPR